MREMSDRPEHPCSGRLRSTNTTGASICAGVSGDLLCAIQAFAGRLMGQLGHILSGTVGTLVTLFGVIFIAAYLLADVRTVQASVLHASPH
jgi:predicted PurR-regulated permease PerM